MLGVATMGWYFDAAMSELKLDVAVVLILAMALLSISVDWLSRNLRARLRIDTLPVRLASLPGAAFEPKQEAACNR